MKYIQWLSSTAENVDNIYLTNDHWPDILLVTYNNMIQIRYMRDAYGYHDCCAVSVLIPMLWCSILVSPGNYCLSLGLLQITSVLQPQYQLSAQVYEWIMQICALHPYNIRCLHRYMNPVNICAAATQYQVSKQWIMHTSVLQQPNIRYIHRYINWMHHANISVSKGYEYFISVYTYI